MFSVIKKRGLKVRYLLLVFVAVATPLARRKTQMSHENKKLASDVIHSRCEAITEGEHYN